MKNKYGIVFLLALSIFSCIDEIEIDLPESQKAETVVEGYVERDAKEYVFWARLDVTRNIQGEFEPDSRTPRIHVLYDSQYEIPLESGRIKRMSREDFHLEFGGDPENVAFQLRIVTDGEVFESAVEKMIPVPLADSLSVMTETRAILNSSGNVLETDYVKLLMHTPLRNELGNRVSLQWNYYLTYLFVEGMRSDPFYQTKTCYALSAENFSAINIMGAQDLPGVDHLSFHEIGELVNDYRFGLTAYFTVVQKSLSPEAIEYWKEVKASNERAGNIYDVFPGRIRSNIVRVENPKEAVHGFFYVSEVDTIRLRITPDVVKPGPHLCALWTEPMIILPDDPDPCLNCLKLANSTTTKPPYWR